MPVSFDTSRKNGSVSRTRVARKRNRAAAWLERFLWAAGLTALGYCAFIWGRAAYDQDQGNRILDLLLGSGAQSAKNGSAPSVSAPREAVPQEGSLVGRIEIPRLALAAVVFEGTSDGTLARGVGHLSSSAAPGQSGNLVLAGHRDTFFRELRRIRTGDLVTVTTVEGPSHYEVESTAVVGPDAVDVLQASGGSTLTLITCYPFRYIGNAPDRFIVRGRKIAGSDQKGRPAS